MMKLYKGLYGFVFCNRNYPNFTHWLHLRWAPGSVGVVGLVPAALLWASLLLEVVVRLVGNVGDSVVVVGASDVENVLLVGESGVWAGGDHVVGTVVSPRGGLKKTRVKFLVQLGVLSVCL